MNALIPATSDESLTGHAAADVTKSLPWSIGEIDFQAIDIARVRPNRELFYVLVAASFVESGSDIYAGNLASYYAANREASEWLSEHWEAEELQHGLALRRYVEHVWPEFDWERGNARFFEEYRKTCLVDNFEPSEALEMAARCVVETGTAVLYRSLEKASDEPVLCGLTRRIANDEVRHYKHFYHYFNTFNDAERLGRFRVLGALVRCLLDIKNEDAAIALRNVLRIERGTEHIPQKQLRRINSRVSAVIRRNLPVEMAIKMLLRPLHLHAGVERAIRKPLVAVVSRTMLH